MKPEHQNLINWRKRSWLVLLLIAWALVCYWNSSAGTLYPMVTPLPSTLAPGHTLLLSDGRVLVQDANTSNCVFLLPDNQGHYVDGTWDTNCAPMNVYRLYHSSDVLTDGRVFVAGGEYNSDDVSNNPFGRPAGATAEIFDPQANNGTGSWTYINPPVSLLDPTTDGFFDSESVILPNGTVLVAPDYYITNSDTLIYNPFTNGWSLGPATLFAAQDEASWVKLPDDSILTIDPNAAYQTNTERYIPSLNIWVQDAFVPGDLYSTSKEIGAALLMTNGTALFFGGNTNSTSAIYTPSPLGGTNWGTWAFGPTIPNGLVMRDAPACILNNGKVLLAFVAPTNDQPYYIYEYDPGTEAFNLLLTNSAANSDGSSMLQLPDGNVLLTDNHSDIYIYQPDPSPLAMGKPAIQSVSYNADGSLHLTGTLFNGISQGAMYGDDQQQDSNYPLVRFTDGSNVTYGRTYNWSSTGVQTGSKIVTTECAVPPNIFNGPGTYSLQVVANGNASDPVAFYGPVWVDFNYSKSSPQIGTFAQPFSTLAQGTNAVASGGTISIKPGHSPETMTISKPMTITAVGGAATIGQ